AASMQSSTTRLCSAWLRVGDSPVVPQGTSPWVPCPTCHSTKSWKAFSSTARFRNGVTSATIEPLNIGNPPVSVGTIAPGPGRGNISRRIYRKLTAFHHDEQGRSACMPMTGRYNALEFRAGTRAARGSCDAAEVARSSPCIGVFVAVRHGLAGAGTERDGPADLP